MTTTTTTITKEKENNYNNTQKIWNFKITLTSLTLHSKINRIDLL